MTKNPICPYCGNKSDGVTGQVVYPHRPDLHNKWFYRCVLCDAYVGCYSDIKNSLGRLANAELRKYKSMAHRAFDPIWKTKAMKRSDAYKALAAEMRIQPSECHIGMFDEKTCDKVVRVSSKQNNKQITDYKRNSRYSRGFKR